jgi:hypothetical protein
MLTLPSTDPVAARGSLEDGMDERQEIVQVGIKA